MHTNCLHARWPYLSGWLLAKHNSSALLCILQPPCSQEEKKWGFIIIIIKVLNDRNSVTKSLNVLLPPFSLHCLWMFSIWGLFAYLPRLFPLRETHSNF